MSTAKKNEPPKWFQVLFGLVVIGILISVFTGDDEPEEVPVVEQVVEKVEQDNSKSFDLLENMKYFYVYDFKEKRNNNQQWLDVISPESTSQVEHAATAIAAAIDTHNKKGYEIIHILLWPHEKLVGTGRTIATLTYYSKGKDASGKPVDNKWKLLSASEEFTEHSIQTIITLEEMRESTLGTDGLIDTDRAAREIPKKLGITKDEYYNLLNPTWVFSKEEVNVNLNM